MKAEITLWLSERDNTNLEMAITPSNLQLSEAEFVELFRPALQTIYRNSKAYEELMQKGTIGLHEPNALELGAEVRRLGLAGK